MIIVNTTVPKFFLNPGTDLILLRVDTLFNSFKQKHPDWPLKAQRKHHFVIFRELAYFCSRFHSYRGHTGTWVGVEVPCVTRGNPKNCYNLSRLPVSCRRTGQGPKRAAWATPNHTEWPETAPVVAFSTLALWAEPLTASLKSCPHAEHTHARHLYTLPVCGVFNAVCLLRPRAGATRCRLLFGSDQSGASWVARGDLWRCCGHTWTSWGRLCTV